MGVLQPPDVASVSLADRAYHAIRDMIVSLDLRPGGVIDERRLIEELGIGRTPIREALRRLAQERLVEVYPRRGMFVTSVEIHDLASLAEVRSVPRELCRPGWPPSDPPRATESSWRRCWRSSTATPSSTSVG